MLSDVVMARFHSDDINMLYIFSGQVLEAISLLGYMIYTILLLLLVEEYFRISL